MNDPGTLVSASWLSGHLTHPGVAIVDVRWSPKGGPMVSRRGFEDAHIPGAGFLDIDRDLARPAFTDGPGRHPLPDPDVFASKLGGLGIDDEMLVVAYDDVRGSLAARLWWMLASTGHRAALLDGGLDRWRAEGGAIETGPMRVRPAAIFTPAPWPADRIVNASAVESTLRVGVAPVIDARAEARYRGDEEPFDPVAGHIPGARSAPWSGNLEEDGTFRSPEELRERYEALGVTNDAAIAYCGSGVNACHELFAMHRAGFGDARLYEGSWSDWVSDPSRPVVVGAEPGDTMSSGTTQAS
jgi:thiosulfate/3-mercaptopyruvate sulfurtransferase